MAECECAPLTPVMAAQASESLWAAKTEDELIAAHAMSHNHDGAVGPARKADSNSNHLSLPVRSDSALRYAYSPS